MSFTFYLDVPISSSLYGSQVSDTIRMTHTSINDNVDGVNDVTDLVHRAHTKEKEKSNIQDLQTNKQDKVVCRNENSNSTNSCKAMQHSRKVILLSVALIHRIVRY